MPVQYTSRQVPRADLSVVAREYMDNNDLFVAKYVSPIIRVPEKAGYRAVITAAEMLKYEADIERAPGAAYKFGDFGAKDISYACKEYGFSVNCDDSRVAEYRNQFDLVAEATIKAMKVVLIKAETLVAANAFNTSTFTGAQYYTDNSSGASWDSATSVDIYGQVLDARQKLETYYGVPSESPQIEMVISAARYNDILKNDDFLAAFQYTSGMTDAAKRQLVASWLGLGALRVGRAVKNTADEGQTMSVSAIWSGDYGLVYVAGGPSDPKCLGTYLFENDSPESEVVESYYNPDIRGEVVRCRQTVDHKILDSGNFGHLLKIS